MPDAPGLGVHLNWDRVWEANRLYNSMKSHDRNDAAAMQYLIPGWKYDHKRPALVRLTEIPVSGPGMKAGAVLYPCRRIRRF